MNRKPAQLFATRAFFTLAALLVWLEPHVPVACAQPHQGCWLAAYLGGSPYDLSYVTPSQFNAETGKNHAAFSRYLNCSIAAELLDSSHWIWAEDTVKAAGAKPIFIMGPYGGLPGINNGSLDASLLQFAQACQQYEDTLFIVWGHEMNGPWYAWGQQPADYVAAFRRVDSLFAGVSTNIFMCWVPVQAWGYPWGGVSYGNGYDEYYPGDNYVDWVGLNIYDRDWDENNLVASDYFPAAMNYQNFYSVYAAQKNKPMMIAETSLFDANWDPTSTGMRDSLTYEQQATEKNLWIQYLYDANQLGNQFPNLNLICWFNTLKIEPGFSSQNHFFGDILVDWRIPLQPDSLNRYGALIADGYFISGVPPTAVPPEEKHGHLQGIDLYPGWPNPFNNSTSIKYALPATGHVRLEIYNLKGELTTLLVNGQQNAGFHIVVWNVGDASSGLYICKIQYGQSALFQKCAVLK